MWFDNVPIGDDQSTIGPHVDSSTLGMDDLSEEDRAAINAWFDSVEEEEEPSETIEKKPHETDVENNKNSEMLDLLYNP